MSGVLGMIKEFAVEPSVMADWNHFRVLWEDFGVAKGRLISRYPKTWNRDVYELAQKLNEKPVRAASICETIRQGKNRFIPSRRDYNPNEPWVANATEQMNKKPFHAIVAAANPANHRSVLVAGELDRQDPRYKIDGSNKVPRTAEALAECAALLVKESEEILMVDPNFRAACRLGALQSGQAWIGSAREGLAALFVSSPCRKGIAGCQLGRR